MKTLLISYDLIGNESAPSYERVHDYIKKFDGWAKVLESLWLVKTDKSLTTVRDELKALTDADDKILVIRVTGEPWATSEVSSKVTDWMRNNM